jgi:hypothetical protein
MSAYALAHLREIEPHPDILEYLEKITKTNLTILARDVFNFFRYEAAFAKCRNMLIEVIDDKCQ